MARPLSRSTHRGERITANRPRTGSGQARQPRAARRRGASGLTRPRPWTTDNNCILSGFSGATTYRHYPEKAIENGSGTRRKALFSALTPPNRYYILVERTY